MFAGRELKSACRTESSRQGELSMAPVSEIGGFPKAVHRRQADSCSWVLHPSIPSMTCEFISEPLSSRSPARPLDCVKLDVRGSGVPQSEKWPCTTERDGFAKKQAGAAHDEGFAPSSIRTTTSNCEKSPRLSSQSLYLVPTIKNVTSSFVLLSLDDCRRDGSQGLA